VSWSIGYDETWNRDIGYGVPAKCDQPGCDQVIDRGLSHVCGGEPYGGAHGCGLFFCSGHLHVAGEERDHAPLCSRCRRGSSPGQATPDIAEWINHKLTDDSWQQWRDENPDEVARLQTEVSSG
jgi:hypothetical protein